MFRLIHAKDGGQDPIGLDDGQKAPKQNQRVRRILFGALLLTAVVYLFLERGSDPPSVEGGVAEAQFRDALNQYAADLETKHKEISGQKSKSPANQK